MLPMPYEVMPVGIIPFRRSEVCTLDILFRSGEIFALADVLFNRCCRDHQQESQGALQQLRCCAKHRRRTNRDHAWNGDKWCVLTHNERALTRECVEKGACGCGRRKTRRNFLAVGTELVFGTICPHRSHILLGVYAISTYNTLYTTNYCTCYITY